MCRKTYIHYRNKNTQAVKITVGIFSFNIKNTYIHDMYLQISNLSSEGVRTTPLFCYLLFGFFFPLTDFPIQPLYYLKAAEAIVTRSHVCNSKWKHAFWFPLLQVVLCKRDLFHHCQQLLMQKTDAQEAKRFGHQWEKKKIKVYLYYLVK